MFVLLAGLDLRLKGGYRCTDSSFWNFYELVIYVSLSIFLIVLTFIENSIIEDEMVECGTIDEFLSIFIGENSRCFVCNSHIIFFTSDL